MKKKSFLWSVLAMFVVATLSVGFTACGDDDDDAESNIIGWYTDLNSVAKRADFTKLDEAITSSEVLSTYRIGGQNLQIVATRDLFFSGGVYNDTNAKFSRLRFAIPSQIEVVHIIDNNTLARYYAMLYEDDASTTDAVYSLYAGTIFGNLTYYGTPTYYTYVQTDNKLLISNGDIYTVSNGGLIKDGSSGRLSKYDPYNKH